MPWAVLQPVPVRSFTRRLPLLTLCTALFAAPAAHAMSLGLGLGGGYWFAGSPEFDFHISARERLGEHVSAGLRAGVLFNTASPAVVGAPIDVVVRFHITRLYIDGFGGPTFLFGGNTFLAGRAGIGIGLWAKHFSVGVEVGWLQPSAFMLLRLGFTL